MRVHFARHGESVANVEEVISNRDLPHGLTEVGRRQARALAESLVGARVVALYASPIPRAVETAGVVAGVLSVPVQTVDALREPDCGVMEGRGDAEAWAEHERVMADWLEGGHPGSRIDGGESLDDVRARFVPFVEGLAARHTGADDGVLLVTHGALLMLMLPGVLDGLDPTLTSGGSLPPAGVVVAENVAGRLVCRTWCGRAVAG